MKHSIDRIYYSILTCGRYFLMSSAESTDLTVPWSFFIRILPLYVHTWEKCFVFLQFSDSWEKLCPYRHKIFVNVNLGVFTFIVLFEVLPVRNHPVALRLQTESHYDSTRFIVPRTAGFPQLVTHFNVIGCKLGVQLQDVVGKVNDGSCRVFCLLGLQVHLRYAADAKVIAPSILFKRIIVLAEHLHFSLEAGDGSILITKLLLPFCNDLTSEHSKPRLSRRSSFVERMILVSLSAIWVSSKAS